MLDRRKLNTFAPLIKDASAWNAFVALIQFEIEKLLEKLGGKPKEYDLIQLSAKYDLLQYLLKARDRWLEAEKGL